MKTFFNLKFRLSIIIICVGLFGEGKACNSGWHSHNGKCYLFKTDLKKWDVAKKACEDLGGTLADITSKSENSFAMGKIGEDSWIGANDILHEGTLQWTDGSNVNYANWKGIRPSNSWYDDCVIMHTNGVWDVTNCAQKKGFICKY